MKKIIVVGLLLILAFFTYNTNELVDYVDKFDDVTFTLYSESKPKIDVQTIDNCGMYITTVSKDKAKELCKKTDNVLGSLITFTGYESEIDSYLKMLKAEKVDVQELNGSIIVYAYSKSIKNCVVVNNKKINVEIAVKNTVVKIGVPLIIGAY